MATVNIKTTSLPLLSGGVTGNGIKTVGATATLTAVCSSKRYFDHFILPDKTTSTDNPLSFTVATAGLWTAVFKEYFKVKVLDCAGGTVTGAVLQGKIGDTITLAATPASGFTFMGYYENGNFVSKATSFVFKLSRDITLLPVFTNTFTKVADKTNAKKYPFGQADYKDVASATVTYEGWKENGTVVICLSTTTGNVIVRTWASGAWADRATLTYA